MNNIVKQTVDLNRPIALYDRVHFWLMSLVHETLYGLFRDPYKALADAGLAPGKAVLEVGCGPGFFTVPAARMVGEQGRVTALDISPLAIDKVQRKIQRAGVSNVTTVLADAARTGLPDHSFDLIFVFGFGQAAGGVAAIFAELHRLLKPGGILAVEGRVAPPRDLFDLLRREGRIARYVTVK